MTELLGIGYSDEVFAEYYKAQHADIVEGLSLKHDCIETLQHLRDAGHYLSIVSNIDEDMLHPLVEREGLFVGHSAGANVAGARQVAREAGPGAIVVTILPDRGDRYFQPMKWEKNYVW